MHSNLIGSIADRSGQIQSRNTTTKPPDQQTQLLTMNEEEEFTLSEIVGTLEENLTNLAERREALERTLQNHKADLAALKKAFQDLKAQSHRSEVSSMLMKRGSENSVSSFELEDQPSKTGSPLHSSSRLSFVKVSSQQSTV